MPLLIVGAKAYSVNRISWRCLASVCVGGLVLGLAGCADLERPSLSKQIDSHVQGVVDGGHIAGAAVVVLRGDTVLHDRGYGLVDIDRQLPAGPRSLFNIASVTKLFTAAALVSLADTGALDLDDSLQEWVPEFPNPEQGARITLRQLVNHSSGLTDYVAADLERWEATGEPLSTAFVLEYLRDRPLDFDPGSHWAYTNSGFYLAGIVIERASGMPWAAYLTQELLAPLGLSTIQLCDDVRETVATGYELGPAGLSSAPLYLEAGVRGDGGLCASALDLAHFPGLLESETVLSAEGLSEMRSPTALTSGVAVQYGLGARLGELQGRAVWGHTGGHAGTVAVVARYPDEDVSIAVLSNTIRSDQDALVLLGEVAIRVFDLDAEMPTELPTAPEQLAVYIGTYRGGRGDAHYEVRAESGRLMVSRVGDDGVATYARVGEHTFVRVDDAYPLDRYVFQVRDGAAQAYSGFYNGLHGAFRQRIDR